MAFFDAQPLFQGIRDIMQYGSGSTRSFSEGTFSGSYYNSLDPDAKSLRALVNTRVSPRLVAMERVSEKNTFINSNIQLLTIELEITVAHHLNAKHKLSDTDIDDIKALDLEAADKLFQALTYPGNLKQDSQGRDINLVSNKLKYLESEFGEINLSDDEPGLLESIHLFTGEIKTVC